MPSRIIRDGWLESEPINALDAGAERFFLRVCLRADDFGRYHANPTLLRSNLFPLKEDVRNTDIPRWLAACERSGLIRCYSADAKPYLEIRKFKQRTRAQQSKFPEPPPDDGLLPGICLTDVSHPRTYSESESYSEAHAEPVKGAARDNSTKSRDAARALPASLDTPEFRTAWERWLIHWSTSFNREKPMPDATALSQLRELAKIGAVRAIAAIENSIHKGALRAPAEPFAKHANHKTGSSSGSRRADLAGDYSKSTF